jgi:hypothetical protein
MNRNRGRTTVWSSARMSAPGRKLPIRQTRYTASWVGEVERRFKHLCAQHHLRVMSQARQRVELS